jgi:hypothetical protein
MLSEVESLITAQQVTLEMLTNIASNMDDDGIHSFVYYPVTD